MIAYFSKLETALIDKINAIFSGKKVLFIGALFYKLFLDLMYIFAVSYQYSYTGMTLNPNSIKYVLSWIVYVCLVLLIRTKKNTISDFFLHFQLMIMIAPLLSYYGLNNQSTIYILIVTAAVLIQICILNDKKKQPEFVGIYIPHAKSHLSIFLFIFVLFTIIMTFSWGGTINLQAFDFKYLYQMRKVSNYPVFINYFSNWIVGTIAPFLLAYTLVKKKYIISIVIIFLELILYIMKGNKVIYLSLIVIVGLFFLTKTKSPIAALYWLMGLACLMITALFLLENTGENILVTRTINSIFGIRFLFIPARNKFDFFNVFSDYIKINFADGQIGRLFGLFYPYKGSIGQVVYSYQSSTGLMSSNSNTGYLGDSYAEGGVLAVLVTATILAYLIKFINNCVQKPDHRIFIISLSVAIIILNDGALLTTLLTGGLFLSLIFATIYSTPKKYVRRNTIL